MVVRIRAGVVVAGLPRGTVTLLFTDIEGSTRLLDALGDRYPEALDAHRRLVRETVAAHGGVEVDTQGDAFFVSFPTAAGAVAAAVAAQRALAGHAWPGGHQLRVRMGLHTGEPLATDEGYVGLDLHQGARICAAGHGGQVLVSEATRRMLDGRLPDDLGLRDLGEHRLKDLTTAQRLHQVTGAGLETTFPPRERHAARFAELAHATWERGDVFDDVEHGNLRSAHTWLGRTGQADRALRLVCDSWPTWLTHGRLDEGRELIEAALSGGGETAPGIRAMAEAVLGEFYRHQGDRDTARRLKEAAMPDLRRWDTRAAVAVLDDLGDIAVDQGRFDDARALFTESATMAGELENEFLLYHSRAGTGRMCLFTDDLEQAEHHYLALRDYGVGRGDGALEMEAHLGLGHVALGGGHLDRAARSFGKVLDLHVSSPELGLLMDALAGLASVASREQASERALTLLGAVDACLARSGLVLYFPDERESVIVRERGRLGESAAGLAWACGRAMAETDATAYARAGLE